MQIYIYTQTCTHTHTHIHDILSHVVMYIYTHTQDIIYIYTHTHIHTHIFTHTNMHTLAHICMTYSGKDCKTTHQGRHLYIYTQFFRGVWSSLFTHTNALGVWSCSPRSSLYTHSNIRTPHMSTGQGTHMNESCHRDLAANVLRHTATHCNTLQHTATHCNTLQHTATHCNTL